MKKSRLVIGRLNKPEVVSTATKILCNLRRDINDLSMFNITVQEIDSLEAQVNVANGLLIESHIIAKRITAVKSKNQLRATLLVLIQQAKAILAHYYGARREIKDYQIIGASKLNDVELISATGNFIKVLQDNTGAQQTGAITPQIINALTDTRQQFIDSISAINAINSERRAQSQARKETFDDVYAKIAHLADIAKTYWQLKKDNRYFDYVLSPKSKNKKSSQQSTTETTETKAA